MSKNPPKYPLRFFRWFCHPDYVDDIEGDLLERFEKRINDKKSARWLFTLDVLKLFRPSLMGKVHNSTGYGWSLMRNKTASSIRLIRKQKFYSTVIVLSLGIAISLAILFTTYMYKNVTVDSFQSKKDRIYRLLSEDPFGEDRKISFILESTTAYIKDTYASVKAGSRVVHKDIVIEQKKGELKNVNALGVDPDFLNLFEFPLLAGKHGLTISRNSIVLGKETADLLFPHKNPIGKTLNLLMDTTSVTLTVSGIIDNTAYKSHLEFDVLLNYQDFKNPSEGSISYFLLNNGTDPKVLSESISMDPGVPALLGNGSSTFYFQPLKEVYFDLDNTRPFSKAISKKILKICLLALLLILLLAGINFINLFMLSSFQRSKELSIRRVIGSTKRDTELMLIIDLSIYLLISTLLAFILAIAILPYFNRAFNSSFGVNELFVPDTLKIVLFIIFIFGCCCLAGLKISFRKLEVVRVMMKITELRVTLNKVILTSQFTITIGLAICAIVIFQQVRFIKQKPLGFERTLIEIAAPRNSDRGQFSLLKTDLQTQELFNASVCMASGNPVSGNMVTMIEPEKGEKMSVYLLSGDYEMLDVFGFEILDHANNSGDRYFVNESLIKKLSISDPIGKVIPGTNQKISGVLKDFNLVSLYKEIPPVILSIKKGDHNKLFVNFRDKPIGECLIAIQEVWEKYYSNTPFDYKVVHSELDKKHKDENHLLKIISLFAFSGISIAVFGLFAISWGLIQNKSKEIGIRKIVGATSYQIVKFLSIQFYKWIFIAFAIASISTYFIMSLWLQNFAFRIPLSFETYLFMGLLSLIISSIVIGSHALKASVINPVHLLRDE